MRRTEMRRTEMRRTEMRRTDRERERERGREKERERDGPHAVQLPQGGRTKKALLSPWRGRGRHSFFFWRNSTAQEEFKHYLGVSQRFWGFLQKSPRTKIRMITLACAQKDSRDGRGRHARYPKSWPRAQDGSHPRDRWAEHSPKSENNCWYTHALPVFQSRPSPAGGACASQAYGRGLDPYMGLLSNRASRCAGAVTHFYLLRGCRPLMLLAPQAVGMP